MTNEEAIKILKGAIKKPNTKDGYLGQALDMAIKALEIASCIKEKCAYCPHCENCDVDDDTLEIKALEQQPCSDCISREAVKEMLTSEWTKYMPMESDVSLSFVLEKISELPSVTLKARWIPCSERLPEEDGEYLVCYEEEYRKDYDFDEVGIAPFEVDCEGFGYWQPYYDKTTLGYLDSDWMEISVIAWMPLPQPYEESEE